MERPPGRDSGRQRGYRRRRARGGQGRAGTGRPQCPSRAGRRVGRGKGGHHFRPGRVDGAGRGQDDHLFYLGGWAAQGGAAARVFDMGGLDAPEMRPCGH